MALLKTRVGGDPKPDEQSLADWRKNFADSAKQDADGNWTIEVDQETSDHIERNRQPGESDNDVIARMLNALPKRVKDGGHRRDGFRQPKKGKRR